tara:strand:+ start:121 stop:1707 length:1587 start_codon:yes stop_codon:yes gene_type:complete
MKKYIFLFFISATFFTSCSDKKEVLEIPLTSNSQEAIELFQNEVFRPKTAYRTYSPAINNAIVKCLELDPKFYLAQALYGNLSFQLKPEERREKINLAYNNIENVSEIEGALISSIYENRINGNLLEAEKILEDIVKKYPDYYYLRIYLGEFQNIIALNPKKSEKSWDEALRIDPDNSLAKLLLSQLHYVTTVDFQLLPRDQVDTEKAINLIKEVEKAEPNNYICPRLLGNLYRLRGDFDQSINEYEKAMRLIGDESSLEYARVVLVNAHNFVFKEEYEKARELYQKSINTFRNNGSENVGTALWSTNTYMYEKKYDEAIKAIEKVEDWVNSKEDMGELQRNYQLYQCDFEKFLTYGHSQMKEDAYKSIQNMNNHAETSKKIRKQFASSESEIERIDLEVEINKGFMNVWYLILFGEFEEASERLKSYSQLSSSYLVYDSKAMINFYKLSGYLNLMSGNIDASISFYDQIPRELLDADNYHLYFYAIAIKAKGNMEKSNELFEYLANYNFAGWANSIVRSLAQSQLKA